MKLKLCVCGKLRESPELTLVNNYKQRLEKVGKLISFSSINIIEYEGLKWTRLLNNLGSKKSITVRTHNVLLDEGGKIFSSRAFSEKLRFHRDSGTSELIFFIGGAEGVPNYLKKNFNEILSFGKMVWPHFLIRAMLMEQIYRSGTILAGLPYHKD